MGEIVITGVRENDDGQRTAIDCYDAADPARRSVELLVQKPNAQTTVADIKVAWEAQVPEVAGPATKALNAVGKRVAVTTAAAL